METSLHRTLKGIYAESESATEVTLGDYRIDAICDGVLIEIQFGSLGVIRDKIKTLVKDHVVRVVKPIIAHKTIVKQDDPEGPVVSRRRSPKRGELLDIFGELVYFTSVFPHENLVMDVPLVSVEHWRLPPDPKRRRRRRRKSDFTPKDIVLSEIEATYEFATTHDLMKLISGYELEDPFDTADLATHLDRPRDVAQRIAYCLRKMGAVDTVGKRGNSILYRAA